MIEMTHDELLDIAGVSALIKVHEENEGYLVYRLECDCPYSFIRAPYIGMTGNPEVRFTNHEHVHTHEGAEPYVSLLGWSSSRGTACLLEDLFADILSNREVMMRCRSCGMVNGQGYTCTRCQLGKESI